MELVGSDPPYKPGDPDSEVGDTSRGGGFLDEVQVFAGIPRQDDIAEDEGGGLEHGKECWVDVEQGSHQGIELLNKSG